MPGEDAVMAMVPAGPTKPPIASANQIQASGNTTEMATMHAVSAPPTTRAAIM